MSYWKSVKSKINGRLEEMEDQESDTYDVEVESIYDENDYEDDDEDVPTE